MYPIESSLTEIKEALAANKDVILTAEPGAGKSTAVPLALKEEPWLGGKKIVMLQPRRIAAVSIARRMAEMDGTEYGKVIGHSVRFSSNIKPSTRIEVLTEGILTRRLQKDPFLEDVGLVIFDEFHERNIHGDLCLALCKEVKKEVRPDLRIMVMSATIDTEIVSDFLETAETVSGKGFLYPVEIAYMPVGFGKEYVKNVAEAVESIVSRAINEEYLVFLPGIGEINQVMDYLSNHFSATSHQILRLHGSMSVEEQQSALKRGDKPRVILSTNIAETSLTIEGITTVIDSGYARQVNFDWQTGLNRLELKRISKASAIQRSGRAGRTMAGKAIRLYSKSEFDSFAESDVPEILRSDPTSVVLEVFGWGISEPDKFNWLEPPSEKSFSYAIGLLNMLGAIDENNQITALGKKICDTPLEPRLACMLIKAVESGLLDLAAKAAAIISEKDFLVSADPDLKLRLEAFENQNHTGYGTDKSAMRRIKQVAEDLKKQIKNSDVCVRNSGKTLEYLLLSAYPDRVCQRRGNEKNSSYTLCSGQGLSIDSESLLKDKEYILSLRQDSSLRASGNGKIFLACPLEADWLIKSPIAKKSREVFFSKESEKVCARERVSYDNLILSEQQSALGEDDYTIALEVFSKAVIQNFESAFGLWEKSEQSFFARLKLIQSTSFGKNFPIIDESWIKANILSLASIKDFSFDWLRNLPISDIYFNYIGWRLREDFEKLVPERFKVPTGSCIRIDYINGDKPILPVKMQEMFGQAVTPAICNGEVSLVVHLLSPAGRPMQITSDLASFWKDGYKSIVGELRGRYPKHSWPDNPDIAKPTKK